MRNFNFNRKNSIQNIEKFRKGEYAIVAEFHKNESDVQTDYFGSIITKYMILGWSDTSKTRFSEVRKLASYSGIKEIELLATVSKEYEQRQNYVGGAGCFLGKNRYSGWLIRKEFISKENGDYPNALKNFTAYARGEFISKAIPSQSRIGFEDKNNVTTIPLIKPKFNIGDKVTLYNGKTVLEITNIHFIESKNTYTCDYRGKNQGGSAYENGFSIIRNKAKTSKAHTIKNNAAPIVNKKIWVLTPKGFASLMYFDSFDVKDKEGFFRFEIGQEVGTMNFYFVEKTSGLVFGHGKSKDTCLKDAIAIMEKMNSAEMHEQVKKSILKNGKTAP